MKGIRRRYTAEFKSGSLALYENSDKTLAKIEQEWRSVRSPTRRCHSRVKPVHQSSEYTRQGTAKLLALFHPADGRVCIQGVIHCPDSVLYPWLSRPDADTTSPIPGSYRNRS